MQRASSTATPSPAAGSIARFSTSAGSGRSVVVSLSADPGHLSDVDAVVRPALADAMSTTGGDILRAVRTGSFANAATPAAQVTDLAILESLDGIESQATLVDGAWPQAGGTPLQATTSDAAAAALGVHVGDRLSLVSRQDPGTRVDAVLSGIWHADPTAAWSRGDPLETTGSTTGGTFTTRGPIVIREADLLGVAGANRVDVEWRGLPDLGALRVADVDALRTGLTSLQPRLSRDLPVGAQPRLTTTLPDTLVEVGRSVLVSRSGIALVTIQFVILAGYAVLLVAGLLVERRRSEIALLRSRGASATHLTRMALLEAVFLAVPAAAVAPLLAVGLVTFLGSVGPIAGLGLIDDVGITGTAVLASVIAGAVAVVILTLPTLFVSASPAGARAADARQGRAGLPQRLGLDIALVAIAVVALAQLRLYGAPLTVNARGALGLDPLLVAAPAIGLIAGAVVALRVVPRIAEVLERFLVRGHGLVGALGGTPARPQAASLQSRGLAPDPGDRAGHADCLARGDLAPVAAGPGGVAGGGGRPGRGRRLPEAAVVGRRPDVPGTPRRRGGDPGRDGVLRPRADDPLRDARRGRSCGTRRRRRGLERRVRGRRDERRAGSPRLGWRRRPRGADPGRNEAARDRRLGRLPDTARPTRRPARSAESPRCHRDRPA